jgi:hypothetical protein
MPEASRRLPNGQKSAPWKKSVSQQARLFSCRSSPIFEASSAVLNIHCDMQKRRGKSSSTMPFHSIPFHTAISKYLIRRLARPHGFPDPLSVPGRLERFSYPSEVAFPVEHLRAGAVSRARGLLNTKAIQHTFDWIWPCSAERQLDPRNSSFIPRAFSVTHINLTHRNWTAAGLPDPDSYVIADPRALVMPFWDSRSVDCGLIMGTIRLFPSRVPAARQRLLVNPRAENFR